MNTQRDELHLPDGTPILTASEKALILKLNECLTDTVYLEDPMDEASRMSFMTHVHDLQAIVMARAAMRTYPHLFRLNGGRVTDARVEQ